MFLSLNTDPRDHSSCALSYSETDHWLQAVWRGYVDPLEARRGAEAYLLRAIQRPSAYLLNDNSQLQGPWFDSLDWLRHIWVPEAARLGLRYVAHIVQQEPHYDILSIQRPSILPFELQLFDDVSEGQYWLHECQGTSLWQHGQLSR